MKRSMILILTILLSVYASSAYAKRNVNSADYTSAGEFLADIETGTTVEFDAYLFSTQPYEDEDTFSLSFVLLPWIDVEESPCMCIYAREEDLGNIHATVIGETKETHYVHVKGIAEGPAKNEYVYINIMDGQGNIEIIDPPFTTYCLDEITDIEEFKAKAVNYLDKLEIKEGSVVKTDDSNVNLNHYRVWVSCGDYTVSFSTLEKEFFVDDKVTGMGIYNGTTEDGQVRIGDLQFTLAK